MTTLAENIARRLNEAGWTCHDGTHEPGMYDQCEECQESCLAVAPVAIAALRAHLTSEATVREAGRALFTHVITADAHFDQHGCIESRTHTCKCGEQWTGQNPGEQSIAHRATAVLAAALDQEEEK